MIVLRPRGSEKETTTTTNWYSAPYYGGFWGSGYYGSGWGSLYGTPGTTTTRTDVYVTVETMVYDLRRNKLVWAGRSKTTNPKDVEDFVLELSKAVGPEGHNPRAIPRWKA